MDFDKIVWCSRCVHFETLDRCYICVTHNHSEYKEIKDNEYSGNNGQNDN